MRAANCAVKGCTSRRRRRLGHREAKGRFNECGLGQRYVVGIFYSAWSVHFVGVLGLISCFAEIGVEEMRRRSDSWRDVNCTRGESRDFFTAFSKLRSVREAAADLEPSTLLV